MIFDRDYYEDGPATGKSLYQNFRWIPELTIPLAHHLAIRCNFKQNDLILDYGCAKGFVVKALRMLNYDAYGMDISEYAISQAPKEIEEYVELITSGQTISRLYDWIITKDTLEHIPYSELDLQLENLASSSRNIFIMVPLGDGQKYNIAAYELDITHHIREDLNWWGSKLEKAGFEVVTATHNMGLFKENWQSHKEGNGLFIGKSTNITGN
ncbi:hypothetical protein LCGC14_1559390 [marine sediment metagenome]|uniref:Methyltransferase domain-containing protein n=1 Tax=marine sediment metagenome TaxID=412755 RepID=A0A0F9L4D7_9ZZZZ